MNRALRCGLLSLSISLVAGCVEFDDDDEGMAADPLPRDYSAHFTPLPRDAVYPQDNPYSAEKAHLGEMLFWDPILSGEQNVACASCHHPEFGWADGRPFSVGVDGFGLGPDRIGNQLTEIHSPTIMNTGFAGITNTSRDGFVAGPHFWDLRAATLEEQALGPIKNPVEMRGSRYSEDEIMQVIIDRLSLNNEYQQLFDRAFGSENPITEQNIAQAIATFERSVNSPGSRFDAFLAGELSALTEAEIVGLNKFIDGGCADCHNGPMLSNNELDPDKRVLKNLDAVRTPSLRNIALTAPYFQDGSRRTLRDAVNAYEGTGDIGVTAGEGDFGDITVFLESLTAPVYSNIPDSVPSGLPVGGDIH